MTHLVPGYTVHMAFSMVVYGRRENERGLGWSVVWGATSDRLKEPAWSNAVLLGATIRGKLVFLLASGWARRGRTGGVERRASAGVLTLRGVGIPEISVKGGQDRKSVV